MNIQWTTILPDAILDSVQICYDNPGKYTDTEYIDVLMNIAIPTGDWLRRFAICVPDMAFDSVNNTIIHAYGTTPVYTDAATHMPAIRVYTDSHKWIELTSSTNGHLVGIPSLKCILIAF